MAIVRNLCRIWDVTIKPEARVSVGIRLFAVFEIALVISTWPLWWGNSNFPQVPLMPVFVGSLWSQVLTSLLVVSAVLITLSPGSGVFGTFVTCGAATVALFTGITLVVLNQQRLQPWHWLFLLNLVWRLLPPDKDRLTVMQHTIGTVYVGSALSRISANPLSGMPGAIVFKSLEMLGLAELTQDNRLPMVICYVLTVGELLVGLLLLCRRTRAAGCLMAMLLHISLLIILGPLGLNHHAGVLLWNLCFLAVVPVLFHGKEFPAVQQNNRLTGLTRTGILATWLFPLSGLIGFADNWPSWQLYSSRPESCLLLIHRDDRSQLPAPLADFTGEPSLLSDWCPVRLDRWSLDETGSPLYPEDRFQLAVSGSVLSSADQDVRFQIVVSEPASPFWWNRHQRSITSRDELEREKRRFVLNATAAPLRFPRKTYLPE